MEFCIGTAGNAANLDIVKVSEDLGFSHHGLADGPLLFSDPFVLLGIAARETTTINVGTLVVNPLTRIPAVLANAMATLNQVAPGRVFFGIGAANNAVRSMGVPIARLAETEDAIRQFKGLMAGERVPNSWRGETKDIQFLTHPDHGWLNVKDHIPVWQAAGGPKSIKSAAKYADAIIYPTGSDPALVALVRRLIDEAAAAHGRDGAQIKLVGSAFFALRKKGDTVEDAMRGGFGNGPVITGDTNIRLIRQYPGEFDERIADFAEAAVKAYTPQEGADESLDHLDIFRAHANGVIDSRHIAITTEFAANSLCLWGDYETIAERVAGMRDAGCDIPLAQLVNPVNYRRDMEDLAKAIYG